MTLALAKWEILTHDTFTDSGHYALLLENEHGSKSVPVIVRVLDRPAIPRGPVEFSEITNDSLTLAWKAPRLDGGSPIGGYLVEIRDKDDKAKEWKMVTGASARTMLKLKRLRTGAQYNFRIRAENRFGIGKGLESSAVKVNFPFKVWSKLLKFCAVTIFAIRDLHV